MDILSNRRGELDFKKRLLVAFMIIILVPSILVLACGSMLISYQLSTIEQSYNIEPGAMQDITRPTQLLNKVTVGIYKKVQKYVLESPEMFDDLNLVYELDQDLKEKYSFIILRKANEIIYVGNDELYERIKDMLPDFQTYDEDLNSGIYSVGIHPSLIKQQDFYFTDGKEGSVFIITELDTLFPQIKESSIQAIAAFMGIIIVTAVILVVWLYRGILRPLNVLKIATNKMKEGNLNFTISGDPEDEMGQLCEDFEEMRIHLKELIEVQMQYERDSRELISNISHDLKTPLTAIKGYAEGIMDGVADTHEKRDKYLRTIYTKASDMSVLVDELSFYSKIDCNTVPYNFKVINIDDYFSDCIEELSLDLEVKNIELGYQNFQEGMLQVLADAEQLKRVINNIIGNAVKYLDKPKGRIEVRIKELGTFVQIEIEDNGVGIPAKDLPFIFDRFYRADASRNSKKGGTGLGLAIAKKIIEDHSGRIWATSEKGVGTTILFTLERWQPQSVLEVEEPIVSKRIGWRSIVPKKDDAKK